MTPRRYRRLRTALERRQPDLTVVMENVHKPHNLSAVLRTCDAVGVLEAHAVVPEGGLRPSRAVAKGAQRWVELRAHRTVEDALEPLRREGVRIVAAHLAEDAVDFRSLDYTLPTALVLGQEKDGVSRTALELCDHRVVIPMLGLVASLNVSVAAALILFEAQRQRLSAGMYETSSLATDELERRLFEWAHPGAARLYRERGEPYPQLDDEGQIGGR